MEIDMPKVSIIMPCFNQKSYIRDAIESVIGQTFKDWELVVVDDASTDGSDVIVQDFCSRDARIQLIKLSNNSGTPIVPRNTGIKQSTGEYIFPLDADDKIAPECLEKLLTAMEMGVADVVYSEVEYFGDKSGPMVTELPTCANMYQHNCVVNSALYKRSDFQRYGGYDKGCAGGYEDWDFWLNFIDDGKAFYRVPEPLFFYRISENGRNKMDDNAAKMATDYIKKKHPAPKIAVASFSLWQKIKLFFIHLLQSRGRYENAKIRFRVPNFPAIKNPRIIMTLLVRNEADIIRENIEFHHAMGIDGFIVTDNASTDSTRDILQEYKNRGWVLEIIDEPSLDYSQADWVHRMDMLAKNKYGADWIINADADEFWRPMSGDFKKALSTAHENILYVPIYNMRDNGGNWYDNVDRIEKPMNTKVAAHLIESEKLSRFHQFSRQIPKCIIRASEYVHIHMGNHNADVVTKHRWTSSTNIMIYHYNSRGLKQFEQKIELGGAAFERNTKLGRDVGIHVRYFYEGIKNGTLNAEQEYEKNTGKLCMGDCAPLMKTDTFVHDFFYLREIEQKFPKIMSFETMLKKIKNGASIARFGDAEFDIAMQRNKNDPYQKPSEELSKRLLEILGRPSNDELIVCIPPFNSAHNNIASFRDGLSFWQWYWRERWKTLSPYFINLEYGNSFFSRDAVFYELQVDDIKDIWNGRDVCFVVPENGRFEYDERLFGNIKHRSVVGVPATNAFDEYDRILSECLQQPKDTLFFIAAGPTATVLVYDLVKAGYQALDMGHFTNCYRQYLGEAKQPEAYPMKKENK